MLTKPEIACAIIEEISAVREDEDLQDFVVEVEDKEFKCHRLMLSACSGFFRALLRSGMKETQDKRTRLVGVSMEAFASILEILYTGNANLTVDNMLSVWMASDQLDITVVIKYCVEFISKNICNETVNSVWKVAFQLMHQNITELCETFLRNNISLKNWKIIYSTANMLGSDLILSDVRDFIKKNYEQVIKSRAFLRLHENDLLDIIKSQDLIVTCEDVVIESIFKWIKDARKNNYDTKDVSLIQKENYIGVDNEANSTPIFLVAVNQPSTAAPECLNEDRKKCLESLLAETRLCLANSVTLEKLFCDSSIMDNKETREMVIDAILYKSIAHQHQLSKRAIYRSCCGLENVGVIGQRNGLFYALSCYPHFKWLKIPTCPYLETCTAVKLISYMTDFFAVGDLAGNSSLSLFVHSQWCEIKKLSGNGWLGVAVEEFVYLINSSDHRTMRFDPRLGNCLFEDLISCPTRDKIEHICPFDSFILAFCSEVIDETATICLDLRFQLWTRLENLEGSAKNLVSFRKEKQLYFLQTNGNLWEVNRDEDKGLDLNLVGVLWHDHYELYGAICYNDYLFIYGSQCIDEKILPQSLFSNIKTSGNKSNWSNIVPAILKKSSFVEI